MPAPLLAKTVKKHVPEFGPAERTAWANAMKQAATYCAKHNSRETKKVGPSVKAVRSAMNAKQADGVVLPTAAQAKAKASPDSGHVSPASSAEIRALWYGSPRTPTKSAPVGGGTSPSSSTAAPSTRRKSSIVDLLTPSPAKPALKPSPAKAAPKCSVREVDYNRMKMRETDDGGEFKEFDLVPGEKGMCVAILGDGATFTSEVTNLDYEEWQKNVKKRPAAAVNKKPAAAKKRPAGTWCEYEDFSDCEGEGPDEGEEEEEEEAGDEVDAEAEPKAKPKAKPAAKAALPKPKAEPKAKAKPAAADPSKYTDEKGRRFDYKTEQFLSPMYYKNSHCVGLRVKGGSQLLSFGGMSCTASKEYLLEIGRQLRKRLNQGECNVGEAKKFADDTIVKE